MSQLAIALAAIAVTSSVAATERVFPAAGGDLASTEIWGGDFPATTDSVKLDQSGTYTASADLSIQSFFVTGTDATIDLTGTSGRTVTLNGDTGTSGSSAVFADQGEGKTLTLKGGTWHSSTGKGNFRIMADTKLVHTKPSHLTISDGCVITNINRGLFLALLDDSTAHLTGGSVIYSTGTFVGTDSSTYRNTITVDGGSWVHSGSHFYPFNSGATNCSYALTGTKTRQSCSGVVYWNAATNCTFTAGSGASVTSGVFYVGVGGKGNCLIVDGAETSFTSSTLDVGGDGATGGCGNAVILSSASSANDYGSVNVGWGAHASDNKVIISNATVSSSSRDRNWTLGGANVKKTSESGGRGNALVFKGDARIINSSSTLTVNAGSEIVIEVPENGFSSPPLQFQKYTYNSSDVVFRLNCRAYRRAHPNGGRVVLATAGADTWLDTTKANLSAAIAAMNEKSEQTGCTFSIVTKELRCDIAPPKGFVLLFR